MHDIERRNKDGYVDFVSLFKLADLERGLSSHKDSPHYEELLRYYFACVGLLESPRLLEPLGLFKHTLTLLLGNKRVKRNLDSQTPGNADDTAMQLSQIHDEVERYESRLRFSVEQMNTVATEVPKVFHFVWLGGGLGAIQRDYLNLWKQVLAEHGYTLNLWYDSDALLAYQTNKLIVDAAKAHALTQVADKSISEDELATLYEERAIVLKQQMYAHINAAVANGESADEARMDLLTRAYGQDAAQLQALKESNHRSVQDMNGFQLRDLDAAEVPLQLQGIYEQEMRLRGNLAAASDVVRVEVLFGEGGIYADVDNLPPLSRTLGEVDIHGLGSDAHLGILQLLLNDNPEWMPGRRASSSYIETIPPEHLPALEAFVKSRPGLSEVFQPPADRLARPFMLRAASEGSSITNAFLMAHPRSTILQTVLERFRFNYEVIEASNRLAARRGVALSDVDAMAPLVQEVVEGTYGPLIELSMEEEIFAGFLIDAIATYFRDGIRLQSEGTIYLTGPGAVRDGMADYARAHFTPSVAEAVRKEAAIARYTSVNRATEEELDHSWKDNETDPDKWVSNEQKRWQEGQYKTRYSGDIAQLLKGPTIEFEQGWPVIEERPVLLTHVLERLVEGLGEPFMAAMSRGHTGAIRFEDPLPLSFDDRQAIRNQPLESQAPAFLNDGKSHNPGVDEVLSDIANGTRHFVETTPLQRLSLGVLLGMDSLHNQRFVEFTGELDNLANSMVGQGASGRYAVIERQLYKREAPGFIASLNSDSEPAPRAAGSALELKKAALTQARTAGQWGRHVAQIQQVATLEHRMQIVEKVGQILDEIEASSIKLVPQDLLLRSGGEAVGGRCYPLALVMSAALLQDDVASRQLRERFYLSAIDPEQADSATFLQALEELRDVQLNDVGAPLDRADLDQVTAALEQHEGSRALMLNSDNHSMLVAKTVEGDHTTYHFYDPNFALFEFEQPAMFKRALEYFFLKQGMARHYAAYGSQARPEFDLIDLHGGKVSDLKLSAGFAVEQLLKSEPLPGAPLRPIRQRLNSARGQSLVNNWHLGSSLLELDSHWWGQQIAHASVGLQELHASVTPLVPLFETLEITPEGKYRVSLINPSDPEHEVQVISGDHRLLRIKNWLSEQFSTLARKPAGTGGVVDPTEIGSVHTLNAGFAIQALMNALRGREGEGRTLTTAVRLHAYVNYAQLVHGTVVDVVGLVQLVRTALREEKIIARTCAPVVGEALGHAAGEGVGAVLGLANVGFDIYQLSTAQNEVEKAQFGTQLTFDTASLALTAGGIGAGLAGASTAAAVLGGAGVILGGLAIGVAALAQGFASILRDAEEVGKFFDDMDRGYRSHGYRFDHTVGAWVVRPSLIVQRIDLGAGKLLLDSPKLFPLHDHFGVPGFDVDYTRAINIRQELNLPGQKEFAPPTGQAIVLPCTPQTFYGYEYKALPFASAFHDPGFDTARRLEKKQADGQRLFLFTFYSFPSHYILHRLNPVYRETVIEVQLDGVDRSLVVPVLPDVWHGKLSYELTGAGGSCSLMLNPGASIRLVSPSLKQCHWVLQASWASESDIRVEPYGELYIGTVHVKIAGKGRHEVLIQVADKQLFSVDPGKRQLDILQQTAPEGLDEQALLAHYKGLAQEHRLVLPYTQIHRYLIPYEAPDEPRYTNAWYDCAEDRFLYIRNETVLEADEAQLSMVVEGSAYFYQPEGHQIWQVDAATGLLKNRYRLLLEDSKGSIRSIEADAHGVIHVVQEYVTGNQAARQYRYLIHEGRLLLSSVTHDMARELQALVFASETLADWSSVFGKYVSFNPVPERDGFTTVDWQPAPYVSICWKFDPDRRDMAWVRSRDQLLIHPLPRPQHTRGWADSIKHLNDLMLLPMADDSDIFFIYDRLAQTLCRLQRTVTEGKGQWGHQWVQPAGLKQVVAVESGYVALDEEGLFFNLTAQGEVQLGGLSEQWLNGRAQWWQALEPIAERYPGKNIAIVGLRNFADNGNVGAWYVSNRLVLCDPGLDKEIRLLGVTPDNQAVWLFDLSSGEIWNQTFIDPQQLDQAFGTGSRLLLGDRLPAHQPEWADWRFADVTIEGAGLRGTTVDGVLLELRHQEVEIITGVSHDWVNAHGEHLIESLQALLETAEHAEFVSVESEPGSLQWYAVQSARLIRITGKDLPADYSLLGTQGQVNVLLHEAREGRVRVYPDRRSIGPFDYVQRNAEVLVVEGEKTLGDLLPLIPDDVNTLILRLGQGAVTYHLTKAVWLRLDSVIVDCRHALGEVPAIPGKLIWAFDDPQRLLFEIVQEHLVIVDPDSEHSLIFRDVCSVDPALRGDVFLAFEKLQSHPVSMFVARLRDRKEKNGSATLQELLAEPAVAG
ncbi:insecticidal toxin [Pseudomonas frederiksbergensis]|jgi:insecticidal toxin|uniref:TcdA/TcdB pore-forming domain-containing protein n=1 Tax=Pseudomonas TaxID=286 RepID=UPI00110DE7BF|nr:MULTISPECIES: TcdA/TcdB pore-forming domain-containing protein [unclassified Pseudomonas]MBD9617600.1 toxin [Pseudomonas sp. PDM07]QDV93542.1 toxin [Pseudomonas sp. ATCC 43928]CAH0311699.1 Toxin A [Pseudomonas sp. Bi130]